MPILRAPAGEFRRPTRLSGTLCAKVTPSRSRIRSTVFRFFESLLPPYPQAEPAAPPKGFFAFLWHCTAGVRGAMLAMSVLHALSDAVASVADHRICPRLDAPATPERVLMAVERVRREAGE